MKNRFLTGKKLTFILVALILGVSGTFITTNLAYSRYHIKYFDSNGSKIDYRGVRIFKYSLRSTTNHMKNSLDYYIGYFDKNGKLKKYQFINNGNIIFEDFYYYKKSKVSKIKTYINNDLIYTTYLGFGPLITKKVFANDQSYLVSYFNEDKKLKKVKKFNKKGKLTTYTKFIYNSKGQRIKQKYFSGNNKLLEYVKFSYNKGLKIKSKIYSPQNKLIRYTLYTYNRNGQLHQLRHLNASGNPLGSAVYEYKDNGKLRYILRYDSRGNLIIR